MYAQKSPPGNRARFPESPETRVERGIANSRLPAVRTRDSRQQFIHIPSIVPRVRAHTHVGCAQIRQMSLASTSRGEFPLLSTSLYSYHSLHCSCFVSITFFLLPLPPSFLSFSTSSSFHFSFSLLFLFLCLSSRRRSMFAVDELNAPNKQQLLVHYFPFSFYFLVRKQSGKERTIKKAPAKTFISNKQRAK